MPREIPPRCPGASPVPNRLAASDLRGDRIRNRFRRRCRNPRSRCGTPRSVQLVPRPLRRSQHFSPEPPRQTETSVPAAQIRVAVGAEGHRRRRASCRGRALLVGIAPQTQSSGARAILRLVPRARVGATRTARPRRPAAVSRTHSARHSLGLRACLSRRHETIRAGRIPCGPARAPIRRHTRWCRRPALRPRHLPASGG